MRKSKTKKSVLRAARRLPTTWPTAAGPVVPIAAMTSEHLENAIASCLQNSQRGPHFRALVREINKRRVKNRQVPWTPPVEMRARGSILLQGLQGPTGPAAELEGDPSFEDLRHRVHLLELGNFGQRLDVLRGALEAAEENIARQARTGAKYREEHDRMMLSTGGLWKTKAGDVVQVRDMDDQHLENAVRFLAEQGKSDPHLDAERKRRENGKRIQAEVEARRGVVRFKVGDRVVHGITGSEGVVRGANERWLTVERLDGHTFSWSVESARLLPKVDGPTRAVLAATAKACGTGSVPADFDAPTDDRQKLDDMEFELAALTATNHRLELGREDLFRQLRERNDELRQRDATVVDFQTRTANQKETIQQLRRDLSERTDQVLKMREALPAAHDGVVLTEDETRFVHDVLTVTNVVVDGRNNREYRLWHKLSKKVADLKLCTGESTRRIFRKGGGGSHLLEMVSTLNKESGK